MLVDEPVIVVNELLSSSNLSLLHSNPDVRVFCFVAALETEIRPFDCLLPVSCCSLCRLCVVRDLFN